MLTSIDRSQKSALFLATLGFIISFAMWGLLSGLMPSIKQQLHLSASQASFLVALPVILGSLGRIPAGMLADAYGGKRVFAVILFLSVLPALALGFVSSYPQYLLVASLVGIGGTAFSVGVSFVSKWFSREQQGTVLGIYGMGNIGNSIAVFGAPVLAGLLGMRWAVWTFAIAALIYAVVFTRVAKDAAPLAGQGNTKALSSVLRNKMSWVLSMMYFQTFGGFVALAIYMPMLLKDLFGLSSPDAGFRTAMFIVVATLVRPLGGWLADRFSGAKLLACVLLGLLPMGLMMVSQDLGYLTVASLGIAILVGLGNGAVFKMVPYYFRQEVGTATGLVGAAGGMGGFFPPLILGYFRDHGGSYAPGFYCLVAFAALCLAVLFFTVIRKGSGNETDASEIPAPGAPIGAH